MNDDVDNPWIMCELCETMIRFNDYNDHCVQCIILPPLRVFPLLLPLPALPVEHGENELEPQESLEATNEQPQANDEYSTTSLSYSFLPNESFNTSTQDNSDNIESQAGSQAGSQDEAANPFLHHFAAGNTIGGQAEADNQFPDPFAAIEVQYRLFTEMSSQMLQRLNEHILNQGDGESAQSLNLERQQPIRSESRLDVENLVTRIARNENDIPSFGAWLPLNRGGGLTSPTALDAYDYYSSLVELIGNVERGFENLDDVSHIVDGLSKECREGDNGNECNEICPICQENIGMLAKDNTVIRKTICNHVFCEPCLQKWLTNHIRCPLCMVCLDELKLKNDEEKCK